MTLCFLLCPLLVVRLLAGPAAVQAPVRDSTAAPISAGAARPLLLKLGTDLTRGFDWAGKQPLGARPASGW